MLQQKATACLLMCLLFATAAFSQLPDLTRSHPFDEPERGATRLLLMPSGHTVYFHFTPKHGVDVTVYDPQHQAGPVINNRIKSWKRKWMQRAVLKGLYEINGQAVVFLKQTVSRKPCLFRLVFDPNTGKLISETLIADLPRPGMGAGYSMMFGRVPSPDFHVRKDPHSGYYAIALFNSFARDRNERIRIIHYSPDHKTLNEAFYESPNGTYKYLNFQDMYVHRNEFVFVTTFAYNTAASGGRDSRILISRLKNNAREFDHKLLGYTNDYRDPDIAVKYNDTDQLLYMAMSINAKSAGKTATMHKSTTDYLVLEMNIIDPATLTVKDHYFIDHPQLNEYARKHLKYKKPYYGVIQDFHLNADNTISLLFEELDIFTRTYSSSSTVNGQTSYSSHSRTYTRLGEMGISRITLSGKEVSGFAIAKSQEAETRLDLLYINRRPQTSWSFRARGISGRNIAGFYSYDYFFTGNRAYVLYNDYVRNTEDQDENYRKKKRMRYISDANTICATYDGKTVRKDYLFGEPASKQEARFCLLEMNTHGEDGKSFATMMIEKIGKKKKAYIVWGRM